MHRSRHAVETRASFHRTLGRLMAAQATSLALPYNPRDDRPASGLVLGAHMAVRSFYRALIEHGSLTHYRFYTAGALVGLAREQIENLASLRPQRGPTLGVYPQLGLANDVQNGALFAYHEPNLAGDAMLRCAARWGELAFQSRCSTTASAIARCCTAHCCAYCSMRRVPTTA